MQRERATTLLMPAPQSSAPETGLSPLPPDVAKSAGAVMTLADFTHLNLIQPNLWAKDVPSVIQELSQRLLHEQRIPDLLPFYHAALNREFMGATDLEAGMAFPHARLPGIKQLSFALGRSRERLPWGARLVRSVRLVFLIAVPASDSTQYMLLDSGLARLAKDHRLVERLHAARATRQIFEVLQEVGLRTSSPAGLLKKAAP